jgi:hypothetical protein
VSGGSDGSVSDGSVSDGSASAAPRSGAATGRRIPVVVVLIGLLATAIGAGDRRVNAEAGVRESTVAAALPAAGVRSSAWYCAGGPVGQGPSGDRVTISNFGPRPVRVATDVMVAGHEVAERLLTVAARSSRTVRVARLSRTPAAAVVVQPLGADVVVEQGYAANGDVAMAPCATRTSSSWYFAAGSTVGGAQQWLSLLNPFAIDAVVDVEAYTENGLRSPGSLEGLVVSRVSRLVVRIERAVAEQRVVAVAVHARNGAGIVATEALVRARSGDLVNASLSLGALAPARTWMFSDNRSRNGAVQQLVLADPGDVDARVRVSVVADVSAVIEPRVVRVPATGAVAVEMGAVPAGVAYTLVVHSVIPVVAETRDTYVSEFPGLVSEVGATAPARRWAFAGGPFTATGLGGGRPRVQTGSQLAVVLNVDATENEIADVRAALARDSRVSGARFVSRSAALIRFRRVERNNPALLESTTKDMLPPSFDVALGNRESMDNMRRQYARTAGVDAVVSLASQGPPVVDEVVVLNPGSRAVQVSVTPTAGGSALSGRGMTQVVVEPGRQVTISLVSLDRTGVAVVVGATGPVVAERFTAGPWGVTRSPGAA